MDKEMEGVICIDTSVLIDHYRKKNKEITFLSKLSRIHNGFAVQPFVHFEIYMGVKPEMKIHWDNIFSDLFILPYNVEINYIAVFIQEQLKKKRKSIEFKDLMIAATAMKYKYPLATLNMKHFEHIDGLQLITLESL